MGLKKKKAAGAVRGAELSGFGLTNEAELRAERAESEQKCEEWCIILEQAFSRLLKRVYTQLWMISRVSKWFECTYCRFE